MMEQEDEVIAKARQLRAAGVPLAEIEKYIASKRAAAPKDDTVEQNAGYPERLATTILEGAQVLPGMKAFEAAAGSLGSKFTDHPVSYRDARAGLEEQTDRMGTMRKIASRVAASPMLIPAIQATPLAGSGAATQGAAIGGAGEALDYNPDESNSSRVIRTALGAGIGGLFGGTASGVLKLVKAPPGTVSKVLGSAAPRNLQRAARTWRELSSAAETPIEKPQIRLHEASAPKVEGLASRAIDNLSDVPEARVLPIRSAGHRIPIRVSASPAAEEATPGVDGLLGNAESVAEAGKHVTARPIADALGLQRASSAAEDAPAQTTIGDIVRNASPFKQQGAPKARFDWFAEQMAKRAAENEAAGNLSNEDLLSLSLEHIKKGGSMGALNIIRNAIKP